MKKYFIYIVDNWQQKLTTWITNYITKKLYINSNKNLKWDVENSYPSKVVYVEEVLNMEEAIRKEAKLKKSRNDYKIELIKSYNPTYKDLCESKI